jgi:hypothetical protein
MTHGNLRNYTTLTDVTLGALHRFRSFDLKYPTGRR